jgi:hypothetical protein
MIGGRGRQRRRHPAPLLPVGRPREQRRLARPGGLRHAGRRDYGPHDRFYARKPGFSTLFGEYNAVRDPRINQLAAKLYF